MCCNQITIKYTHHPTTKQSTQKIQDSALPALFSSNGPLLLQCQTAQQRLTCLSDFKVGVQVHVSVWLKLPYYFLHPFEQTDVRELLERDINSGPASVTSVDFHKRFLGEGQLSSKLLGLGQNKLVSLLLSIHAGLAFHINVTACVPCYHKH